MKTSALPQSHTWQMFTKWKKTIDAGEIQTVMTFPLSGVEYRIQEFFEFWQEHSDKELIWVDQVFNQLEDIVSTFIQGQDTKIPIIAYGDRWQEPDLAPLFSALTTHQHTNGKGMLVFLNTMIAKAPSTSLQYFTDNIFIEPLLSEALTIHFVHVIAERWQLKIDQEVIAKMYTETGGHTWLLKQLLREMRSGDTSLDRALQNGGYLYRRNTLRSLTTDDQRTVLRAIANNTIVPQNLRHVENYLRSIGYISDDFKSGLPEFLSDLEVEKSAIAINVADNSILFDSVRVDSFFTEREKKVVLLLLSDRSSIVTREEIGTTCWTELYSDWALDALLHRLRKKIEKLSGGRISLLNEKGKGYRLKI